MDLSSVDINLRVAFESTACRNPRQVPYQGSSSRTQDTVKRNLIPSSIMDLIMLGLNVSST